VGLKLNGTHQLLAYVDDVNLLGDNILLDTIKKNTEILIYASNDVGLQINAENSKYILIFRHQNVGQNRGTRIANRSYENVSQFKYFGTTVTNQNLIQGEIKRRLNSDIVVQNIQHACMLTKIVTIRIFKIIILLVVLCG
jgi:hypothetical protein